jgi:Polyketide cyclase / dehydrase and lipid transport
LLPKPAGPVGCAQRSQTFIQRGRRNHRRPTNQKKSSTNRQQKEIFMKWLLIILAVPVIIILALLLFGLFQPVKHSVTRSIHSKQKPEAVFAVLDNLEGLPDWSTTVLKVERLPAQNGKPVARVTLKWGHLQMLMTQLERTPSTRLVTNMAREGGATMGTWTYQLSPEADGCRVALTEQGEIANPLFRAIGRIRGLDANIIQTLHDLAMKFGENVKTQTE